MLAMHRWWQPCDRFVPKGVRHFCKTVCGAQLKKGEECDYGGIRLVAAAQNVLFAELKEENKHAYRHPTVLNYDEAVAELATEASTEASWHEYWKHMLWRFGGDGTIHQPSGLYLTASRGESPIRVRRIVWTQSGNSHACPSACAES